MGLPFRGELTHLTTTFLWESCATNQASKKQHLFIAFEFVFLKLQKTKNPNPVGEFGLSLNRDLWPSRKGVALTGVTISKLLSFIFLFSIPQQYTQNIRISSFFFACKIREQIKLAIFLRKSILKILNCFPSLEASVLIFSHYQHS